MIRLLHFSDAHIDTAAHGRLDPQTGLPVRVMDFLISLDVIVDTAITEKVDLVIFAGDAYKDRSPSPTYQREWGKRIIRLSNAGIPTLLLVGNHDLSPAIGRAHALQEFSTLQVPHVRVIHKPQYLTPSELEGIALQVIAIPWVSRAGMAETLQNEGVTGIELDREVEAQIEVMIKDLLDRADPTLPLILTAHATVQGAVYGGERLVSLGGDIVLSGSLVRDPRIDYVALGHIHKAQDLNYDLAAGIQSQPPIVYPGSIEKVDFGEATDDKFFVIADIEKGKTTVNWRKLEGRRYFDRFVRVKRGDPIQEMLLASLPEKMELKDAMLRLVVEYPRDMEVFIDEPALRAAAEGAFEFHFIRRPQADRTRILIPEGSHVSQMSPVDLVAEYWKTISEPEDESRELTRLAQEIIIESSQEGMPGESNDFHSS